MFFIWLLIIIQHVQCSTFINAFTDKSLYDISWNGPLSKQAEEENTKESVVLTTQENEKYKCLIPHVQNIEKDNVDGPKPEALLADLLDGSATKCSYRLETYWTYEVCHGHQITQFHKELDNEGRIQKHEYSLGKLTKDEVKDILHGSKSSESSEKEKRSIPTRWINGKETPYFSVEMSNGTPCELNGQLRSSQVLYVCHKTSKNNVISVKEVTSCRYEVIVLTPILCGNPSYIVKNDPVNIIQCHAMDGSPSRPVKLFDHHPADINNDRVIQEAAKPQQLSPTSDDEEASVDEVESVDEALTSQFLEGIHCLIVRSGWWNYELCHGRHVQQFHQEPDLPKTTINLGFWDKMLHLKLVEAGAFKPKNEKMVAHWYSNGDICDLTGEPRNTFVVLICGEEALKEFVIYTMEVPTCQYTIYVASPVLCPFVKKADSNGLFGHLV